MAAPALSVTITNGTSADASQVMQDFNDVLNAITDGTKDLSIGALTTAGAAAFNGNVTLGNASSKDVTFTGSLASSIPVKTAFSYDIGANATGLRYLFFGSSDSAARSTKLAGATIAAAYTFTLPIDGGTNRYVLQTNGSGTTSWAAIRDSSTAAKNYSLAGSVAGSALTITLNAADGNAPSATNPVEIVFRSATAATGTPVTRAVTSALTTVISSGSTAGFSSGATEYLNIYAIDNAGSVELAWSNGRPVDEGTLVTTTSEGGGGGADTRNVLYSTTLRSNVAARWLGRMKFTLTTAGTWDEVPDEISLVAPTSKIPAEELILTTGNGHGSTNNCIRRFQTEEVNTGSLDFTYADSAANGMSVTIKRAGFYAIDYIDATTTPSTSYAIFGISVDSNQLTTAISSITAAHRKAIGTSTWDATNSIRARSLISIVIWLNPNQVVRCHTDTSTINTEAAWSRFSLRNIT